MTLDTLRMYLVPLAEGASWTLALFFSSAFLAVALGLLVCLCRMSRSPVLGRLARLAAQALGREFDMEIVETHHNRKVDAPSGTAKLILRQIDPEGLYAPVYGRSGRIGARGREIGVHAVRGGTAAGEHSLRFFGRMEELELRHRADSREIFAQGALRAAAFAQKAEPGLYDMEDVLFGETDGRDRKAHSNGREKNAGQGLCSGEQAAAL